MGPTSIWRQQDQRNPQRFKKKKWRGWPWSIWIPYKCHMCNYPEFPEGRTWAKCTPFTVSNVCEENQKNELSHSVCGAGPQLWSLLSFLRSQETEAGGCVLSGLGVGGLGNIFFFPWVNSNQCGLLETEIEKQTHILGLWLWFFHWHLWKPSQVPNFPGR